MRDGVRRDDPLLLVDDSDGPAHSVVTRSDQLHAQGVGEGVSDERFHPRVSREKHPVAAKQADRACRFERDAAEELFEICEVHGAQHHAGELAPRTRELARTENAPCPGRPVEGGLAEEGRGPPVRLERLEVVAIGDVDGRNGPVAAEIDQLAVSVDQGEGGDLRQCADLVSQHQMDVVPREGFLEVFGRSNAEPLHATDHVVLHQLQPFECAFGLFRQHKRDVAELALAARECALAERRDQREGDPGDRGDENQPGYREQQDRPAHRGGAGSRSRDWRVQRRRMTVHGVMSSRRTPGTTRLRPAGKPRARTAIMAGESSWRSGSPTLPSGTGRMIPRPSALRTGSLGPCRIPSPSAPEDPPQSRRPRRKPLH